MFSVNAGGDIAGRLNDLPALTVTLFMVGRAGIAGSWAAAQIFSAEVFPTVVRWVPLYILKSFTSILAIVFEK